MMRSVGLVLLFLAPTVQGAAAPVQWVGGELIPGTCSCFPDPGIPGLTPYDTEEECLCAECGVSCPGMTDDPHLKSWKGEWFDYMGECDLKLMSVPKFDGKLDMDIHARTTIRYDYSYIEAAAVRIGDDILEVDSWAAYAVNGIASAESTEGFELGGYPIHHTQISEKVHKFEIVLRDHQNITLSTFKDWVSVKVVGGKEATFGQVSGLMGTFNGQMLSRDGRDLHDDINALGQDWQVLPEEDMLFLTVREPQAPNKCKLPSPDAKVTRRLGEGIAREAAENACAHLHGNAFKFCVHDVMVNGDLELAQFGAY